MKKSIVIKLVVGGCVILLAGVVFLQSAPIPDIKPASVAVEADGKLKRGKTRTLLVKVDLGGAAVPGGNQAAALGSYVIPISFDRTALEFISAGGGETPAFAPGPFSVTNAQAANAAGMVTLVGSQATSESVTGMVSVASLSFRVIAAQKGNTTVSIGPELAAPGLSLASPAGQGMTVEPYRIATVGQSTNLKIK